MARKRGNNEGSIHQRDNGSWRAQASLQGRRLSFTANTRRECVDWLKKTISQIDDGMNYAHTKISLEDYIMDWFSYDKSTKRQTTWMHYDQLIHAYILPQIGDIKIINLRPEHIQKLYGVLVDQGVGIYTVLKIHTILHSALSDAVKLSMINRNPVSLIRPPKVPEKEMTILNEFQVRQLLIVAKQKNHQALYHMAVTTGMRQMELLGLKWTDVDWNFQTIRVERQLLRPNKNGIQFGAPKTNFGKRSIALGVNTMDVLRHHNEQQQAQIILVGEKWGNNNLIFSNGIGGPIHPRNLLRDFKKLLQEANLPEIRFHDLRHTAASIMLNNGIAPIIVSRILGHSKTSITLDLYGHLIPGMQDEAVKLIDELVSPIELHPVAPVQTPSYIREVEPPHI